MTCPSCRQRFPGRTVCPTCTEPLRPKTFTIVAGIYFVISALGILANPTALGTWIGSLVTVAIAWYLLRMRPFAIGLAMIRAVVGVVFGVLVLFVFNGTNAPGDPMNPAMTRVLFAFNLVLNLVLAALLLNPKAWEAFRLARAPRRALVRAIEREDAATAAPGERVEPTG